MLDRTPTDSGSRESELQLDEVMVFVAKLVVVSGICRCTTLYCLNKLNNTYRGLQVGCHLQNVK